MAVGMEESEGGETAEGKLDLEFLSCVLQPPVSHHDPNYVGLRRFLLLRKFEASPGASDHRMEWRCNGKGYVAYRNFIRKSRNWDGNASSATSTPGNSGRLTPSTGPNSILFDGESLSSSKGQSNSQNFNRSLSIGSVNSDFDRTSRFTEPAYSFVGMHCIFDSCKSSVTNLRFGHMSSHLLAYAASDGSLTICEVSEPPSIVHQLRGHSKEVTDFDFSCNNQYIASTSMDKTVRVWELSRGLCIRVVYGVSPQLCIRFHPVNNNFLLVGNSSKEISVINFSTGRVISKLGFDDTITSLDTDHTGQLIFAGDGQGCIHTVSINVHSGSLSRVHKHRGSKNRSAMRMVQYRTFSLVAHGPVLLACAQDGNFCFFSVAIDAQGYLTLISTLKLAPRVLSIRASFCPLLSLEKGEFIVSGSDDSNVYFYDLTRPKNSCVNKLQGHSSPVIGVAWNYGENLLASSDSDGTVIVWKRAKTS